jgi:hypothetical protein
MKKAKLYQVNPRTLEGRIDFTKYQPKDNDLGSIHVEQEQIRFNKVTGVKESKPCICQYDPRTWAFVRNHLNDQGWSYLRVLFMPKDVNYDWLYVEPAVEVPDHIELLPDNLPPAKTGSAPAKKAAAKK